jgi:hypothetical protein
MNALRLIVACCLVSIFALPVGAQNQTPMNARADLEVYNDGISEEGYHNKQAALSASLSSDLPRGFDKRPIDASLTLEEQAQLDAPQSGISGVAPLRVGLVKTLSKTASVNGFPQQGTSCRRNFRDYRGWRLCLVNLN